MNYAFNMLLASPNLTDSLIWTVSTFKLTERETCLCQFPRVREPKKKVLMSPATPILVLGWDIFDVKEIANFPPIALQNGIVMLVLVVGGNKYTHHHTLSIQ